MCVTNQVSFTLAKQLVHSLGACQWAKFVLNNLCIVQTLAAAWWGCWLSHKDQCVSAMLLLPGDLLDLRTGLGHQLQALPVLEELQGVLHTQSSHCGVLIVRLHLLLQDCSGAGCGCHS